MPTEREQASVLSLIAGCYVISTPTQIVSSRTSGIDVPFDPVPRLHFLDGKVAHNSWADSHRRSWWVDHVFLHPLHRLQNTQLVIDFAWPADHRILTPAAPSLPAYLQWLVDWTLLRTCRPNPRSGRNRWISTCRTNHEQSGHVEEAGRSGDQRHSDSYTLDIFVLWEKRTQLKHCAQTARGFDVLVCALNRFSSIQGRDEPA